MMPAGLRNLLLTCNPRLARRTAWGCSTTLQQQARQLSDSSTTAGQADPGTAAASAGGEAAATTNSATSLETSSSSSSSSSSLQDTSSQLVSTLITGHSSRDVSAEHIGLYYEFNKSLVPEAFQPFQQAFYSPRPSKLQRKGGCRGLQAEFTSTNSSSLMWRRSSQELAAVLADGSVSRLLLQGPAGAGKSVTLVQLAEWARSKGWLVLYVPSAATLTRGGFFYKRPDGTYDTIISAQHILKSAADSHQQQLQQLPARLEDTQQLLRSPAAQAAVAGASGPAGKKGSGGGGSSSSSKTLWDLVTAGLSTDDDGQLAVECCLALVNELAVLSSEVPVLLAVDDYNMLYWQTDYGRTIMRSPRGRPAYQFRVPVPVAKLNLARSFRLLQRTDLQQCRVVVATTSNGGAAPSKAVPAGPDTQVYHLPRFSEVETAHTLFYYSERGVAPSAPSQQQVAAMRALTNGSGADLRKVAVQLSMTDIGLL